MKLTRTSQMLLVAGFMAALISGSNTAMAQNGGWSQLSYEVKYSELFPQQAESIRQTMRGEKNQIEAGIRNALNRGDQQEANRLVVEGRARMQTLTNQVKSHCISTTVVVHGTASDEDIKRAMDDLQTGKSRLGTTIHIRGNNGGGGGARPQPQPIVQPRPTPRPVVKPDEPNGDDLPLSGGIRLPHGHGAGAGTGHSKPFGY